MDKVFKYIQAVFAVAGGIIGAFLGGADALLYALIGFVGADYATGVIAAWIEKKLSSQVGFKGIAQKVAIFILVGVGHVVDTYLIRSGGSALRTAVIMFYIANEGISIMENAGRIGLPLPKKLKAVLIQIKSDSEDSSN